MENMSVADYLAIADRNGTNSGSMLGNSGFLWVILIFLFFLGFSGNGLFGRNTDAVNGLSQLERDVLNGNSSIQRDVLEGNTALANNILTSSCSTQKEILESRYTTQLGFQNIGTQMQQCCCDIKGAIHAEGEATRALITENTIQALRDQLNGANQTLANQVLANSIINQVRPYPSPAYPVCSPYTAYTGCGCNGVV